jgi:hypothetical protein
MDACSDQQAGGSDRTSTRADTAAAKAYARSQEFDRLATSVKPLSFDFPTTSAEGGDGQVYVISDSVRRIDVQYYGETGRRIERYYEVATGLQLAVAEDAHYDRPHSGRVIQRLADSTWFHRGTVVRWVDSANVYHPSTDSAARAHGREVLGQYLWAAHMAGTRLTRHQPSNER